MNIIVIISGCKRNSIALQYLGCPNKNSFTVHLVLSAKIESMSQIFGHTPSQVAGTV